MKRKRPSILVNDIAAVTGGALSILKQFLREVSLSSLAQEYEWYVFVGSSELACFAKYEHIHVVNIGKQKYLKRLYWDNKGIWNWTKINDVNPSVAVSLMNVGFRNASIPTVVYVHQSLPFGDYRSFKLYEWIPRMKILLLPFEMKMTTDSKTEFVVQTNWMKSAISTKLKVRREKTHVIRPEVELYISTHKNVRDSRTYKLFYPAVPGASYKNHELLIRTLSILKKRNQQLYNMIRLSFTCKPDENRLTKYYYRLSKKLSVDERIEWKGYLSKTDMLREYLESDIVLFPSKLETFGLPLIEAASFGCSILVLDKPYSHEALSGYDGVEYLGDSPQEWFNAITDHYKSHKIQYERFNRVESSGWKEFIELVIRHS